MDPVFDPVDITRRIESSAANTFRLTADPPVFVRGAGAWLEAEDGRRYLDLVCGSATTLLGHGHPAHRAAIEAVLETGVLHTGTRLPSPSRAALYAALRAAAPAHLEAAHLANSGAEAVETAMKAAIAATGRRRFLAFEGGYHGRTLGALSLTHSEALRGPFEIAAGAVDFAPYASTDGQADAALQAVNTLLARRMDEGRAPAAIIVEAVQGVSGVRGPSPRFLQGLETAARRHGALLILDEIWSGLGRSGRWFAFEHGDIAPDLVTLGKGLSASLPLSAVLGRSEILQAWRPGAHTSTFQGNPLSCAAAVATLETLQADGLVARAGGVLQDLMTRALQPALQKAPVRALRVVGAQAAIEMENAETAIQVQIRALAAGVLVYGGGLQGECVMLVPPLNIDEDDLSRALATLLKIIDQL